MPKPTGAKVKPPAAAPAAPPSAPPPATAPPLDPAVAAAREELASAEKKRGALVDELRHVEKQVCDVRGVVKQRRAGRRGVGAADRISVDLSFPPSLRFTTWRRAT